MKTTFFSSPSAKALTALTLSWTMVWTLGALIQRANLAWGLCVTEIAFIALPAWILLRSEADLKEPGCFRRPRLGQVFWVVLIAVGAIWAAVSRGLAIRSVLGFEPTPPEIKIGSVALIGFGMVILAPLCEELLFRAVLLRSFLKEMSSRNAVFVSAALFALYHGSLQRLPETFILGLFLGMIFVRGGSYWLSVILHVAANLVGPGLFFVGKEYPELFHPLAVLPLILAAVYGVYRLGGPPSAEVKGRRARLAWALFGAAQFPAKTQSLPRLFKVVSTGMAMISLSLIVWGYVASGQRPGSHNSLSSRAQPDRSAFARGSSNEEQVWHLISPDRILVRASHSSSSAMERVVDLPYAAATIVGARSERGNFKWKSLGNGTFELGPETLDEAVTEPTAGKTKAGKILIEYELPLSALEQSNNYRVKLYALRPVGMLRVKLVLDEGCGFEFRGDGGTREMQLFQGGHSDGPRKQLFGTCGFDVRARPE